MSTDDLVAGCTGTQFTEKQQDQPHWKQPCRCAEDCWLACVLAVAPSLCAGDPTDSYVVGTWSIRSNSKAGTVLTLPIQIQGGDSGCTFAVGTLSSFDVTVGTDTGGWVSLGTISNPGEPTIHLWWNAFNPDEASHYCDPPGYAVPIGFATSGPIPALNTKIVTFGATDPTPNSVIKWRDGYALAQADLGAGAYNTWSQVGDIFKPDPLVSPIATIRSLTGIKDPGSDLPSGTNIYPDNTSMTTVATSHASMNKATFATPSSPQNVDMGFDVDVTFTNPFTGAPVDGTNDQYVDDSTDEDIDTAPDMDTLPEFGGSCPVSYSGIVRNGYGNYTIQGIKILKKGIQHITIFADHERSSFIGVGVKFPVHSGDITVTAGAAAYVDLIPPDLSFAPVPYQIGAPILDFFGGPLTARVLDSQGLSNPWNVVDGDSTVITLSLIDGGGNAIAAPVLHGIAFKPATSGVAKFGDLDAHALGRNYTIHSASPLTTAPTSGHSHNVNWFEFPVTFWVGLAFEDPGAVHAGVDFDFKVDLVDAKGALVKPDVVDNLTLSGTGGFTGYGTVAPVMGVATFHGHFPAAGTYLVQVLTSGATYDGPPVTQTFTITVLP